MPVLTIEPAVRIMAVLTHPLFIAALAALVVWVACRWWYGRRLKEIRRQLERDLPTVPSSRSSLAPQPSSGRPQESTAAPSIELLEQALREEEAKWHQALPFLNTSPLAHEVGEQTDGVKDRDVPRADASGGAPIQDELLHRR